MPLKRVSNHSVFLGIMVALNEEIRVSGKENVTSIHTHAEVFSLGLLNLLFGWSLKDANEETRNASGIDLIDDSSKYVVQVSAECTKEKMERSLSKDIMKDYADKGYRLKFLFIGRQNENSKKWQPNNPYSIDFESKTDVILTSDLAHRFNVLDMAEQDAVVQYLYRETGQEYSIKYSDVAEKLDRAIRSLGPRYTPEANVSTENEVPLETLMGSQSFWTKLNKKVQETILSINQISSREKDSKQIVDLVDEYKKKTEELLKVLSLGDEEWDEADRISWALSIKDALDVLDIPTVFYDYIDNGVSIEIPYTLRSADASIRALKNFVYQLHFELLDEHFLVVEGKAGVGKSHMLADFCERALSQGHLPFLFLGQHFVSGSDPWRQILDEVSPGITETDFFNELKRYAETHSKKAIIVIDALNEGDGKRLWKSNLQRFVDKLANYPEIKLVLSIRSPFKDAIFPETFFRQNQVVLVEHVGLGSASFNAIIAYCDYFEIPLPVVPMFGEEYENPLFLKLVCSMIAKSERSTFTRDYTLCEVLDSYLEDINSRISESIYLDYDRRQNLVSMAVDAIVSHEDFEYGYLSYECAYQVVCSAVKDHCDNNQRFLTALLDESLLICSQRYKGDEEIIVFSFERVGDYYRALSLLSTVDTNIPNQRDQIVNIKEFEKIFASTSSISINQGILEALAIILPEKHNTELHEVTPDELINDQFMIDHYVQSLAWRSVLSLEKKNEEYIANYVWKYRLTSRNFITILIRLALEPRSAFNAEYLHGTLDKMKLLTRDMMWTAFISKNAELDRLVDWLWSNYETLPEELIELAEVFLTWCLTSTKRFLRDSATKAIACLIKRKPSSSIALLKRFIGSDDMYITERLLAATYGAISHTPEDTSWVEAVEIIYKHVFAEKETYAHVLVRDYAYSIISVAIKHHKLDEKQFKKVIPPYKSAWYKISPTNDDIDKFRDSVEKEYGERSRESSVAWQLIHSMTTEYGRGTSAYGDFGRYVFGYNVGEWNNQFNDQDLSNIITWNILSQDRFFERFTDFDYDIAGYSDRHEHEIERIGKKYQWIGMFELIARLLDNYPPYTEEKEFTHEYLEYQKKRSEKISAMLSSGNFSYADIKKDSHYDNEDDFVISIKKNYFSNTDIMNALIDLRNIDPSFIWKDVKPSSSRRLLPDYFSLLDFQKDWAKGPSVYSDLKDCRVFEIEGRSYISLYVYDSQKKGNAKKGYGDESVTWFSAACFMQREDISVFNKSYLSITHGSAPTINFLNCFLYDHFDGLAYKSQMELHEAERSETPLKFTYATQEYFHEAYNDNSMGEESSVTIVLPSEDLVAHFELHQISRGIWLTREGKMMCFDTNILGFREKMLLFDLPALRSYLAEKKLALVWGEYFEKTSSSTRHEWWHTVHMNDDSFDTELVREEENAWDLKLY